MNGSTSWKRRVRRTAVWAIAFVGGLYVADSIMTGRSAAVDGSAKQAATRPTLMPDVQAVVDRVVAAYAKPPFALEGEVVSNFDVAGIVEANTLPFRGSFRSADTFRHDAKDELTIVANETSVNVYDQRAKQYLSATRPSDPATPSLVGGRAMQLLHQQNPALFIAVQRDALDVLAPVGSNPTLSTSTEDGRTLDVVDASDRLVGRRVAVDHASGRLVRLELDFAKDLEAQGAAAVKRAKVVIRYREASERPSTDDATFAFVPPPGSTEARPPSPAEMLAGSDATVLEGRDAPPFTLTGLDGKAVSLAEAKGSVLVLDFWATTCGPCVMSLPHLDETAKRFADRGVKVYAVDQGEDVAAVRRFVEEKKLTSLTPLLDADGAAGGAYLVSAIPQTVVIGRDGKVAKVVVGYSEDVPATLDAAIEKALAAPAR